MLLLSCHVASSAPSAATTVLFSAHGLRFSVAHASARAGHAPRGARCDTPGGQRVTFAQSGPRCRVTAPSIHALTRRALQPRNMDDWDSSDDDAVLNSSDGGGGAGGASTRLSLLLLHAVRPLTAAAALALTARRASPQRRATRSRYEALQGAGQRVSRTRFVRLLRLGNTSIPIRWVAAPLKRKRIEPCEGARCKARSRYQSTLTSCRLRQSPARVATPPSRRPPPTRRAATAGCGCAPTAAAWPSSCAARSSPLSPPPSACC